ncbi:MAG: hypothetical protein AB202_02305 [Parcubacteria bacterium C7867-007]|nr:MAG: hypothetical protein AB202_02305 [Parcubacteria bacterium C7867-007]
MVEEERFKVLVAEAWEHVPEHWRAQVQNVALLVEDEPSDDVRAEEGLGPEDTLLGLYHGVPNTERGEGYGVGSVLPDTITLYRIPILEEARHHLGESDSPEVFEMIVRTVIQETLWHEIGHYFGLSEGAIDEREQEGTNWFEP